MISSSVRPAQVGDAVLGDHEIAQVPRNGLVSVVPHDVGGGAAVARAGGAHAQDRARPRQRVRHGDEVVLTADAAHHLPALQRIGDRSPEQRHHHGGVDAARGAPLQDTQLLVGAVELVHERHPAHAELRPLALGQLAQRRIESARTQKEPGMQHLAVAQLAPQTLPRQACAARRIGEIGRNPSPAGGAHAPVGKLHILAKHPVALELRELRAAQHRARAGTGKLAQNALIEALERLSRAQQPLEGSES